MSAYSMEQMVLDDQVKINQLFEFVKNNAEKMDSYSSVFCSLKYTKSNLNLSAKNVNLFLSEPLLQKVLPNLSSDLFF